MSITFKLEQDGDKWHAYCPELPGCHTFGSTKEEALKNLKDAVMLYMEDEIENQSLSPFRKVIWQQFPQSFCFLLRQQKSQIALLFHAFRFLVKNQKSCRNWLT
jgi:predicted RNase H-like HicB family nuclease